MFWWESDISAYPLFHLCLIINLNLIRTYSLTNTTQHDFPSNIFLWMLLCETYPYWSADKNRMHEARVKRFVGFFLESEALFFLLTCCIFRYSYKTKYSGGHENFVKMNKNFWRWLPTLKKNAGGERVKLLTIMEPHKCLCRRRRLHCSILGFEVSSSI